MSETRADHIKPDWKEAQNDAQLDQSNLIEIARFMARRAAERDFKAQQDKAERKDSNGN